ncbi:MAG: YceI family protein [Salinibacter sp.]|uniref:YceI family protein n=1 Tax=Salinibacter sp. TaxID=2065818 RepID=UPI0035D527DA
MVCIVGGLSLAGSAHWALGQNNQLTVHSKSRFWIQGEATTHDFTCQVLSVDGSARLPPTRDPISASTSVEAPEVRVTVPVEAFDCGNRRMTRDLQETLKMKAHPKIRFELVHASVEKRDPDASAQWRTIEALGALTIAGTKRLIRLRAKGQAVDKNHFRVRGCKPIRMSYFGVEPPTKALGLIRVKNRVEVQFDLLARPKGTSGAAPFDTLALGSPPSCEK